MTGRYSRATWPFSSHARVLLCSSKGNVSTTTRRGTAVKGALWQVLPIFEEILAAFEVARSRHLPVESQFTNPAPSPASSPLTEPSPTIRRTTRHSQYTQASTICNTTEGSSSNTAATPIQPVEALSHQVGDAEDPAQYLNFEHHFSTNINAGWQKLDEYYRLTDRTPIYRAATLLHPCQKWRWFDRCWGHDEDKASWIDDARVAIQQLWDRYKDQPALDGTTTTTSTTVGDEWNDQDDNIDQMQMYLQEPYSKINTQDSPNPYWLGKVTVWPQLSQMALDLYGTPACSDEPERVFSMAGNLLMPRRRQLSGEVLQQLLCLRSWQASGIIKLDQPTLTRAVVMSDGCAIDEDLSYTMNNTADLLYSEHDHVEAVD